MKLAVLGIHFKTTPLAVRERLAWAPDRLPAMLARLAQALPDTERVLLSTCNRTELYVAGAGLPEGDGLLREALWPGPRPEEPAWYTHRDLAAAQHLMTVAASLDSMVVGETEILGQVKQAYLCAADAGAVGATLHAVFQAALRVAKRVHAETDICRGRVSVSAIAVDLAERVFEELRDKSVLIIGAGDVAEQALRHLTERGARDVRVWNRSAERAAALAAAHGGVPVAGEPLTAALARADVAIVSTRSPEPLVRAADIARLAPARRGRPMLLIDLGVPRNVDPDAGAVDNVYLYHLDDLQRVAAENLAARQDSVARAQRLVREGALELAATFQPADLGALLRRFDEYAGAIRDDATRRCLARPALATLSEAGRQEVARAVDGALRKLLAAPREALKSAARNGRWDDYARVTRDLFRFADDESRRHP